MPKHFMIFYREVDHQHYLYNGEWPIAIDPISAIPFGQFAEGDTYDTITSNTENVLDHLNEILLCPRKRLFTINKRKYMIIHRGVFIED